MRQDVTGFFTMLQRDRARGGVGIRAPARGGGNSGPGAGWEWGFRPRARGGVGIRARRGVGWRFGPGRGVVGIRARARGGVGIRARRGVGIIWGKMGNFLPFCRFFAVWVGICISSRLCMILYFQKLIVLYSND